MRGTNKKLIVNKQSHKTQCLKNGKKLLYVDNKKAWMTFLNNM